MKNLHKRILILTYFEDEVPLHNTDKEQQEWYAALGRMVAYGLRNEANKAEHDTMQYVSLGFRKNPLEIDACYNSEVVRQAEGKFPHDLPKQCLNTLHDNLTMKGESFVMGAVLHSDGVWSFHS